MSQPFYVTGLPRSRTSWLANLFTTDQTICYHDKPYSEHLLVNPRRVGFSGPEIVTQFDEINQKWPEAPWLVVFRKLEDSLSAFKVWSGTIPGATDEVIDKFFHARADVIAHICTKPNVRAVEFSDLDDETTMRLVWAHLLPGIGFDLERWQLLCNLNVQQQKAA